jgi:hypothetical protein
MSEEQENFESDDYPLGCLFALLIIPAVMIIVALTDYWSGEVRRGSILAFIFGVIFLIGLSVQIIVKIIKANSKK